MNSYKAALFSLVFAFSTPAVSQDAEDPATWPLYEGVNSFIAALEAGNRSAATGLVVPLVNEPGGQLKIPEPERVYSTLLGCEPYGLKYSMGSFPGTITRWRCGEKHYSLWLRPSYDGQPGKVQLTQFGEYSNAHLHGRGPTQKEPAGG